MVMPKATNIKPYAGLVSIEDRCRLLNQKGATIWFTGISGSGKSTIATTLEKALLEQGIFSYLLDSDNVRTGINQDLGFSEKDRKENIRRIGEITKLFVEVGFIVLSSFISPYKVDRDNLRRLHEEANLRFFEIFVDCSLVEAERRDPKGLYRKARKGEIKGFTGIDDPYESPKNPEINIDTTNISQEEAVQQVLCYLESEGYIA